MKVASFLRCFPVTGAPDARHDDRFPGELQPWVVGSGRQSVDDWSRAPSRAIVVAFPLPMRISRR